MGKIVEQQLETEKAGEWKARVMRILRLVGPQLTVVLLLAIYLLFGALSLRFLDDQLAATVPFTELVLFCFETLATIGYGNICPSTPSGRFFVMIYSLLGIPLCMLTIANLGKHLTKAFWVIVRAFRDKKLSSPLIRRRLPLVVLLAIVSLAIFSISLLCPFTNADEKSKFPMRLDHIYFGLISFTTVGFGDYFPSTESNFLRLLVHLFVLSVGMISMGLWFSFVRDLFMNNFCFHRRHFRHVQDVPVWFGRRRMRLSNLLEVVAKEFQASPTQIHQVLDDLDFLISDALLEVQSNKKSSAMIAATER
uniref:Potassium channel domain-containing protein n=1 Tax=Globodera rostochiensis TaxID=31243 RepID=A0A914GWG4_GLORO